MLNHPRGLEFSPGKAKTLQERLAISEQRLKALLELNQSMAEASSGLMSGRSFMERALAILTGLVGAVGCTFVPIDEWRQPLPPFTYGDLPDLILSAWSTQLANGMLRERCGRCKVLQSTPGACPLHPAQIGNRLTVYCVLMNQQAGQDSGPIQAEDPRPAGVFHFFFPTDRALDNEDREFINTLLSQVALAYEAARLREQEQVTLRQLQMLHAPEGDFATSLSVLLEGLVQALEVDFALIRVQAAQDERVSGLNIQRGDFSGLANEAFDPFVNHALNLALQGQSSASQAEHLPAWLGFPLVPTEGTLPDGKIQVSPRGVLLVGVNHPHDFHPRQRAILQAVAAQAALLVENERLIRSLEYKIVIQERARLAREIHDGLAQTLAFLKLQAAQMQTYLAQGDLPRLARILKDNYQTLADAYLDTRQAIDDLRLTPQEGLERWLDHILTEFENATGLPVLRNIQPVKHFLEPEVQAQLIRIVQEALSNIRKHARAQQVQVCLFDRGGETILEVSDDGQGFSAGDVPDITQHGLRGMRERAEMIGADFQIISQSLSGTTLRLVLPATLAEEPAT